MIRFSTRTASATRGTASCRICLKHVLHPHRTYGHVLPIPRNRWQRAQASYNGGNFSADPDPDADPEADLEIELPDDETIAALAEEFGVDDQEDDTSAYTLEDFVRSAEELAASYPPPEEEFGFGGETGDDGELSSEAEAEAGRYNSRPERPWTIPELFAAASYPDAAAHLEAQYKDLEISGLQSDPSKVQPNDLYLLLPDVIGTIGDLDAILQLAIENNPAAILSDMEIPDSGGVPVILVEDVEESSARLAKAFYDDPSSKMTVVAVAGGAGKTTVSWLVRGILEELGLVAGMVGSIEYAVAEDRLDVDGEVWTQDEEDPTAQRESSSPFHAAPYRGKYWVPYSTPPGAHLQKLLAGMNDRGAVCAVVEAEVRALMTGQLEEVQANVAVFTNFACDRLEEDTLTAEEVEERLYGYGRLFGSLHDPDVCAAVINLDDPMSEGLLECCPGIPVVTYSYTNEEADVYVVDDRSGKEVSIWETDIVVRTPMGRVNLIYPMLGEHNVYNVLAAVATGVALRAPLEVIGAGIESVDIIPGRCEVIDDGQLFSVIVDSARNPAALAHMLLAAARAHQAYQPTAQQVISKSFVRGEQVKGGSGRTWLVFGCPGQEDQHLRPLMAQIAYKGADTVIVTADSPRLEDTSAITSDIVAGLPDDVLSRYTGYAIFPLQDQTNVPLWFEPYVQSAQKELQWYIMQDRFSAIRSAIGTAQEGDVVLVIGRGADDCMQYADEDGGVLLSWFDDRVECRAALGKLKYLNEATYLDRQTLPWGDDLHEAFDSTAVF